MRPTRWGSTWLFPQWESVSKKEKVSAFGSAVYGMQSVPTVIWGWGVGREGRRTLDLVSSGDFIHALNFLTRSSWLL